MLPQDLFSGLRLTFLCKFPRLTSSSQFPSGEQGSNKIPRKWSGIVRENKTKICGAPVSYAIAKEAPFPGLTSDWKKEANVLPGKSGISICRDLFPAGFNSLSNALEGISDR